MINPDQSADHEVCYFCEWSISDCSKIEHHPDCIWLECQKEKQ